MTVRELAADGQPLITEGELGRACYVILEGEMDVTVASWGHTVSALRSLMGDDGNESAMPASETFRLGPGACIGARTMVLGHPLDFSAVAAASTSTSSSLSPSTKPVVLLALHRRDYQEAMLRTVAAAALERIPALAALSAHARAEAVKRLRHQARAPGSKLFDAVGRSIRRGGGRTGLGGRLEMEEEDAEAKEQRTLYVVGSGSVQLVRPTFAGTNPSFERHLMWPTAGAARAAAAADAAETRGKGIFRRAVAAPVPSRRHRLPLPMRCIRRRWMDDEIDDEG